MVKFSAQTRAATGAGGYLDEVERSYARCRDLTASEVRHPEAPATANIPLKVAVVFHTGLRRVVELTESFVAVVNDGRPGTGIADALLETANVLKDLQRRVEKVVNDKTAAAIIKLDKRATDLLSPPSSTPEGSDRHSALNTVTGIDRTHHEQVKTAVYVVRLGLLLVITVIERYMAVRDEFIRECEMDRRTRGGT